MDIDLEQALQLHRQGHLEQAILLYRQIHEARPRNAEVLHLLGLASYQLGQASQAVVWLSQAIALQPRVASYHCNLAEALRVCGDLPRAWEAGQAALALEPNYPEARNNLGVIAFFRKEWREALVQFREAVRLRPGDARYLTHLGDAQRESGRLQEAAATYRRALALDANLPAAHANLGPLLLMIGEAEAAEEHCRRAVAIQPDWALAHMNLGRCLRELGRLDEAMDALEEAHRLEPQSAMLCLNIGEIWQEVNEVSQAVGWYERALAFDPHFLPARCDLAGATAEHEPEAAVDLYRSILAEQADCVEAQVGLGNALWEMGDAGGAVACLRAALDQRPEAAGIHTQLGHILASMGNLEESIACHRAALSHNRQCAPALNHLATTLRGAMPEEDVGAMEKLLAKSWLPGNRRGALHAGLAHVYDGRKDPGRAADHAARANALQKAHWAERGRGYDPGDHRRQVEAYIAHFSTDFFQRVQGWGLPTRRPVFVVGMPRSGTTLTEQILASHPRIHGAGERPFAMQGFRRLPHLVDQPDLDPVECLNRLTRDTVRILARRHLQQLESLDHKDSNYIVDKMPDNYAMLGWLATLFPQGKFIHVRRDLRDVALSCWMTNFAQLTWSCDLIWLAERINDYLLLTDHWRQVLPVRVLEVNYEDMVADQEGETRKIMDFLELEWHPACMDFHKTERLVRTASISQVRQPIYQSSVARWKPYETALEACFSRLHRTR